MKTYGLACLLLAGCAGPSSTTSIPEPGSGIAEFRKVTRQAYQAVADTVDSLEPLRSRGANKADPQLARFDRAFNQLELTSLKARARAEAIIARGQNYFDEWKEQLPAGSAQADYHHLYDHFTIIRQRSTDVREMFRPFMASLREFRAKLDVSRTSPDEIHALTTSGRRVLKALESLSAALNGAETELHATLHPKK